MNKTIKALFLACFLGGCATENTQLNSKPTEPIAPTVDASSSAPPMPPESIGLFLETEARKGPHTNPFTILCNVNLRRLHSTSTPLWMFPKTVFYAEKDGKFFALRRIETHSGGITPPYKLTGLSVTLPRPPSPGKWRIFAIQEHSEIVFARRLESHRAKNSSTFREYQDGLGNGIWTKPLISNSIFVEFSELNEEQKRSAESVIQGLIEAEQYDPDFREPTKDPTSGMSLSPT